MGYIFEVDEEELRQVSITVSKPLKISDPAAGYDIQEADQKLRIKSLEYHSMRQNPDEEF